MKRLICLAALAAFCVPAVAADLPVLPLKAPIAAPKTLCTLTDCSGFYAGADISGMGSNLDILGSGINGSVFAGGMMFGVHAGYQLWNGAYFAAGEVGCAYDAMQNLNALGGTPSNRFMCREKAKVGMQLAGVFGIGTGAQAVPSQGPVPINIPALLQNSLMSPFVVLGAVERFNKTGMVSGAGASFLLSANWSTTIEYNHLNFTKGQITPIATLDTEDIVRASLDSHF